MADVTTSAVPPVYQLALPPAAIVCITIGAYILLIVILLIIRSFLLQHGMCQQCNICGKEGEPCCVWCVACGEACNCCKSPSFEGCIDAVCPCKRRKTDCAEIVMCQCWSDPSNQCCDCCNGQPLCDCGSCNCNCQCQPPDCDNINCFCFTLQTKTPLPPEYG